MLNQINKENSKVDLSNEISYARENFQVYQEIFSEFIKEHSPLTKKQYVELKNIQKILRLSKLEIEAAEGIVYKRLRNAVSLNPCKFKVKKRIN